MTRLPLEFSDMVGFSKEEEQIVQLLREEKLPPVILFYGRDGIGKSLFVAKICAYLLCEKKEACGLCESCLSLKLNKNRDLFFLDQDDPLISVEKAFLIKEHLSTTPASKNFPRLVFIRDADRLTEQSTNKLLTVFEDLPPHTYVFMTTGRRYALLKTLLSRSVAFLLKPPGEEESLSFLAQALRTLKPGQVSLDEELALLKEKLKKTRGAVGLVFKSLSEETLSSEGLSEALFRQMLQKDYSAHYEFIEGLKKDTSCTQEDILQSSYIALNRLYRASLSSEDSCSFPADFFRRKRKTLKTLQSYILDKKIKLNKGLMLESLLSL